MTAHTRRPRYHSLAFSSAGAPRARKGWPEKRAVSQRKAESVHPLNTCIVQHAPL